MAPEITMFINNAKADVSFLVAMGKLENDVYSVIDYLKTNYRAGCPQSIYDTMVNAVCEDYQE